ncbi:MAG: SIS domain-containing protein, partial [Candidatus Micrarchaeia archaeon]
MEDGILKKRASEHIDVAQKLLSDSHLSASSAKLAAKIASCFKSGGKLLVFGNGGSAADAQHMAAEFGGRYMKERRALPASALTAN